MIKLLLLDEQKIYKAGLTVHFQNEKNIHIPETKNNIQWELEILFNLSPAKLIDEISSIHPDVILVDPLYNNSNRLPFIKKLLKKLPHLKIIILSNSRENIYLIEARNLGVKAFLIKTDPFSEVLKCVIGVANGSNDYHIKMMKEEANGTQKELTQKELTQKDLTQKDLTQKKSLLLKSLNSTEYDIFKLLSQRKKIIEVAAILNISERKAYQYRKSMMYKLNLECEFDLLKIFLDQF